MIRPLVEADVDDLAARLSELPLMMRYHRTAAALAADLRAGLVRGDGMDVYDQGGPRGIAWYQPAGTLGLGGYLRLLAVTGEAQGRGAGAALLVAFETGVATVSRHAFLLVSDFNSAAQRFYEKHGYSRVGALAGLVLPDVTELYRITAASADGTAASADGTAASADGTAASADGTAASADGTAASADGTAASADGTAASADQR